jgi:hypothetical protein
MERKASAAAVKALMAARSAVTPEKGAEDFRVREV